MMGPPELPEGLRGFMLPLQMPALPVTSMPAGHEITLPVSQVDAMVYLSEVGYAHLIGKPPPPGSLKFAETALRAREGSLESMLDGMRTLFQHLAAVNGEPPRNVANAMTGTMAIVGAMVNFMDEVDREHYPVKAEEDGDGASTR